MAGLESSPLHLVERRTLPFWQIFGVDDAEIGICFFLPSFVRAERSRASGDKSSMAGATRDSFCKASGSFGSPRESSGAGRG